MAGGIGAIARPLMDSRRVKVAGDAELFVFCTLIGRPVFQIWPAGSYPLGQWLGVYGYCRQNLVQADQHEDAVRSSLLSMGEWIQRNLQTQTPG